MKLLKACLLAKLLHSTIWKYLYALTFNQAYLCSINANIHKLSLSALIRVTDEYH